MASNMSSLLNKKKWKGAEVGKAIIANLVNDFRNRGERSDKPLFTQADLDKMTAGFSGEVDGKAYNAYVELYNAMVELHNRSEALHQQAQNGYYRLLTYVTSAQQAEHARSILERVPVIMTQRQYKEAYAKKEAEARAISENYQSLIIHALAYYLGDYDAKPKVPKPIKDALSALKKEPFTNQDILDRIPEHHGWGYYTLPNGSRSDQLSDEEWQEALKQQYLKTHELQVNGKKAGYEETLRAFNEGRTIKKYKAVYEGKEDVLNDDAENEFSTTWNYDDPPSGLTKWDIIASEDFDMREYYSGVIDDGIKGREPFVDFIDTFPQLYEALRTDIIKHPILSSLKEIQPNEYESDFITWGELADADIYNYKDMVKPNISIDPPIDDEDPARGRAFYNGIAILVEGTYTDAIVNENGTYREAYRELANLYGDVEKMANDESARFYIQVARDTLLIPALREITAINTFIKLLAEAYDVPDLAELQTDLRTLLGQVDAMNNLVVMLCKDIDILQHSQDEAKLQAIRDLFPLIDLEHFEPSKEKASAIADELNKGSISSKQGKALTNVTALINQLMDSSRGEEAN